MLTRFLAALAVGAVVLAAWPVLPQSSTVTPTPTPGLAFGFDPVRATLHASFAQATPRGSTRGFDPVIATFQAAYAGSRTPAPTVTTTATPTPITYTRGYDPLFLTMQAWADHQVATDAPCGWMWASQPLTDLTERVQAAITEAGAEAVTFDASAYGENCIEADGQTVRTFITQDVVFRLRVAGTDAAMMGDALALALPVVQVAVKAESRPLAEIGILFPDADLDPIRLSPAMLDRALVGDARGAALVARLYAVALR